MLHKHKPKHNTKKKLIKLKIFLFLFFIAVIVCFFLFLIQFENNVMPTVLVISEKYTTTQINNEINTAVEDIISEMNLKSSDFYNNSINSNQQLNYLSVDTMLINNVCSKSASKISERLSLLSERKIYLPIGIFSNFEMLSNIGPKFGINITSMGDATVDYETSFEAVGINQINFQIWLNIETEVNIVNPFFRKPLNIKRKLMLVNTVFNGEVPKTYLGLNEGFSSN